MRAAVSEPIDTIRTPIALEAHDLLPETWDALADTNKFGPAALERRHNRIVKKIFGSLLTQEEQEAAEIADGRLIEYAGKYLAYALLDPAIDYFGKQIQSHSIGERETETYGDRIKELQELKKQWLADLAELEFQIGPLIPVPSGPAKSTPRVIQAGETVQHVTPDPLTIEPGWLPPERFTVQ